MRHSTHHHQHDHHQELILDTIVRTRTAVDLGAGDNNVFRFPDTKVSTDEAGHLTVYADEGRGQDGASVRLHRDLWWTAVRGDVLFNSDDVVLVRRNL